MKYLVIARRRETVKTVAGALQAAKEYVNNELKSGRSDCVYLFASGDGSGMGIANADSHEQLSEILLGHPEYQNFDWDIQPLCEFNRITDKLLEAVQRPQVVTYQGPVEE
jgi:muconolactone delta-isomerase